MQSLEKQQQSQEKTQEADATIEKMGSKTRRLGEAGLTHYKPNIFLQKKSLKQKTR